jgi:hypothetical protein
MKIQVLATILLVCGMMIGIGVGTSLSSVTNNTAGLNQQINDLKYQNTNQTQQIQDLYGRNAGLNNDANFLSSQVANLTSSLAASREALLTPSISMESNRTAEGAYDLSILSISNVGVRVDLVSINVTPSVGVTIGHWNTQDQTLRQGDFFTISNLNLGDNYTVNITYMPTTGEMATYRISVPAPVGELSVTKVADGVYNITLVSISPDDINTSQIGTVLSTTFEAKWEGTLEAIPPFHVLKVGDYLLGSNLTYPGDNTYTLRLYYLGNSYGSTIAFISISVPGAP